ncbi:hypothetical protein O181_002072 [Austropuccinia psidii MF-1]|uniref:Ribosomal protein S6 n=1 Tax=Austropuccinia psidii MF-1 TaxID=1389203 RepID=A0A9Q3GDM9_9BASI|nr:hypothetical protein [Austropuccinia psidii MF-1]
MPSSSELADFEASGSLGQSSKAIPVLSSSATQSESICTPSLQSIAVDRHRHLRPPTSARTSAADPEQATGMPLYSLSCLIHHYPTYPPLRTLVHTAASLVEANGGLVRQIDYLGRRNTPQRIRAPGIAPGGVGEADYWTMQFDANPPTVRELTNRLRVDPRVLRHTTLLVGSNLRDVTDPRWNTTLRTSLRLPNADEKIDTHQRALDHDYAFQ